MLKALTEASVELQLNDRWVISVEVLDDNGDTVSTTPVVTATVTSPAAVVTTPTLTRQSDGTYRTVVDVPTAGLWVAAVVSTGYGAINFAAYTRGSTTAAGLPTVQSVRDYSPDNLESWSDADITAALTTEIQAQIGKCGVRTIYPSPLVEALKRRVMVNLAKRSLILPGSAIGDSELSLNFIPGRDNEINRLEAPYLKVVLL